MGTQKGKLFELAKMYHTYQNQNVRNKKLKNKKKPVEVKGEHFDEGKSISLSYNFEMYPEVLYDSHQRHASVSQMSVFENVKSEAFYVEPFDEDTVEIPYRETTDEDEKLEGIATGFGGDGEEIESMEEDVEKMKEMEGKLDDVFKSDDESSAMEATDLGGMSHKKAEDTQTATGAPAKDEKIKQEVKPYNASDEEFARDLGAILKGQKVYDAEQKKSVGRHGSRAASAHREETGLPAKSSAYQDDMMDPNKNEHMIFEKIAQSMTYANSYDLGSIALNEKFELMDEEIDKEEISKILRDKRSKAADDAGDPEGESSTTVNDSAESMGIEKYDSAGALDNNNGGRLIKENVLQNGDLILTSSSGAFDMIDGTLGSESIAGIYTGSNKLLTKGDGGALEEKALQPHTGNKGVMVALRHQSMSSEKASSIIESLTKLRPGPEKQAENWLKINCPSISMHPDVCNSEDVSDKKKCNAYAGRIYLGTMGNDSFTCAESIINSFEKNKLGFVPLLTKEHNGSLKYLGHLKNKA